MDTANMQADASSFIGKLLRGHFGKGPESVFVAIGQPYITVYIRGFMSPTEKVLMAQKEEVILQKTRDLVMASLIPEIKAYLAITTGYEIGSFYYDWGLHNRSAMFVVMSGDTEMLPQENAVGQPQAMRDALHQEIINLSKQSEKQPDDIFSHLVNPRTVIVEREGILVAIERELIRMGMAETLKLAKRSLEKALLHNNNHFEAILGSRVHDIFVDWDFEKNKSVIVFCM
ncbi:Na-translocating system protein MpsC family protein [Paenibacillus hexagrammi]|uniref:DUF2294 domain-containing protein n=1 Tax=Paenibacillus hexagrammi TaxID=2908839 RepID=A0ABY3SJC2_9BACL|nr:Na-translocating system protein MpsC family protein [Paenibacillus sp. YPD9-1]UJF33480.1 DUF2294 domain-containing protein [Paenibacillus sp. YPD9-1]